MEREKSRKYYRKCGVCEKRHEQSEMVRASISPNGWMCGSCYHKIDKISGQQRYIDCLKQKQQRIKELMRLLPWTVFVNYREEYELTYLCITPETLKRREAVATILVNAGWGNLKEFAGRLRSELSALVVNDSGADEAIWNLGIDNCVYKLDGLLKEYLDD